MDPDPISDPSILTSVPTDTANCSNRPVPFYCFYWLLYCFAMLLLLYCCPPAILLLLFHRSVPLIWLFYRTVLNWLPRPTATHCPITKCSAIKVLLRVYPTAFYIDRVLRADCSILTALPLTVLLYLTAPTICFLPLLLRYYYCCYCATAITTTVYFYVYYCFRYC